MDSTEKRSLVDYVTAWLRPLLGSQAVFEVRALGCTSSDYRRPHTRGGFFDSDHLRDASQAIVSLSDRCKAEGVYFTLNPLKPSLLARRANRVDVIKQSDASAKDDEVSCRHLLLVDCDPVRPGGISSSNAEHDMAQAKAREVAAHLGAAGWPSPIVADSGNGWHLLYRIDLPADDSGIIQRCLQALSHQFSDQAVSIDTSVFNPARICKAYGSWARKGDNTPDRPHRRSYVKEIPDEFAAVPVELLRTLAAMAPQESKRKEPRRSGRSPPTLADRVRKYLAACRPSISGEHGHDNAYRVACELVRGFSLSVDDAFPLFDEWNQRCDPPWSHQDLMRKLEEADRKADGEAGYLLRGDQADTQRAEVQEMDFDLTGFGKRELIHPLWHNPQIATMWKPKLRKFR